MRNVSWVSLVVLALVALQPAHLNAATVEVDVNCTVGTLSGDFKDGQTLRSPAVFFPDNPIVLNVGDTVIVNLIFDHIVHVFDFGDHTDEFFTFGLDWSDPNVSSWSGTWTSSIEALDGKGDIWVGPFTVNWQGSGAGFGWGGTGVPVTENHASFAGIRWTTTITSANEGNLPLALTAFTGIQFHADAIRVLP